MSSRKRWHSKSSRVAPNRSTHSSEGSATANISTSLDEATPRTLIGNILSTHATAEMTRILQRTAVSPQRQSPRRRSARMDTTLRKKVAIQNVMKDATEGPTPRSLIQAVVAQAPVETPVQAPNIHDRSTQELGAESFEFEISKVTASNDQTVTDSFTEPLHFQLRDRAWMLKEKKLGHKARLREMARNRSLVRLGESANTSLNTTLGRQAERQQSLNHSSEDPTPRSLIQALVYRAPLETPVVGTELRERQVKQTDSVRSLSSEDVQTSSPADKSAEEDSFLKLYRNQLSDERALQNGDRMARSHRVNVDVDEFVMKVKHYLDKSDGDTVTDLEKDKTDMSDIVKPMDTSHHLSVDDGEETSDQLPGMVADEQRTLNAIHFDAAVQDSLQKNAQPGSRDSSGELAVSEKVDTMVQEAVSESKQKQIGHSEVIFSDDDDDDGDGTEMQVIGATSLHLPKKMIQLKILELLKSPVLQSDSESNDVCPSFDELAHLEVSRPVSKRTEKPKTHRIGRKASKSQKATYNQAVPLRLPRSLTKSIVQHFSKHQRISNEVLDEIEKAEDQFWKNVASDLVAYAHHADRNIINESDVVLLMKRQGFITPEQSLYSLVEEYLPLEYRQEIIPIARAGNVVELKD